MNRLGRFSFFLVFLFAASTFWQAAHAQPDPRAKTDVSLLANDSTPYTFVTFEAAREPLPNYRVHLAVPKKASPPEGYPVLYLLDGNAAVGALGTRLALLQKIGTSASPPVLVMIGFETEARFAVVPRAYDYTPPISGKPGRGDPHGNRVGGAEGFRDFIVNRLKPEIEQRLRAQDRRIDPQRQGLWGHSYGGLFALHILLNHPRDFQEYFAISPSLWYHDGSIARQAEALPNQPPVPGLTLFAMTGADESGEKARWSAPPPPGTVVVLSTTPTSGEALLGLAARLKEKSWCRTEAFSLEGKSHGEMFAIGLEASLNAFVWQTRGN